MDITNTTTQRQSNNGKTPKHLGLATVLEPGDPDDGDTGRQQRGIAIAALTPIVKGKLGYMVPSQSGQRQVRGEVGRGQRSVLFVPRL